LKKDEKSVDTPVKILIIVYINKENEMEKVKNESKKVKPSKKVLVAQLMDAGVDPKIVKSLERANIDTLTWVKGLISS